MMSVVQKCDESGRKVRTKTDFFDNRDNMTKSDRRSTNTIEISVYRTNKFNFNEKSNLLIKIALDFRHIFHINTKGGKKKLYMKTITFFYE